MYWVITTDGISVITEGLDWYSGQNWDKISTPVSSFDRRIWSLKNNVDAVDKRIALAADNKNYNEFKHRCLYFMLFVWKK